MRFKYFPILAVLLAACQSEPHSPQTPDAAEAPLVETHHLLDWEQANRLAALPLNCMQTEFPNKTGQVLSNPGDLGTPKELHPAFYGCFDWHSSVHGHWSLVKLLKEFPDLEERENILSQLQENINEKNIQGEIDYFNREQEYSYERMYGWNWLMKLQLELDGWDTQQGKELSARLQPLTDLLVERYITFLPKLNYPLREGLHSNTAFGLTFAYDYAGRSGREDLKTAIRDNAIRLYTDDAGCPLNWEPGGFDFLSPCLEEVELMERILPEAEFSEWMNSFLPQLADPAFTLEPGKVSDREDGHLVHLDGLNFSRAWVFYRLADAYPEKYAHLKDLGDAHMAYSLPSITDGSYEGEHWLASFALYALSQR